MKKMTTLLKTLKITIVRDLRGSRVRISRKQISIRMSPTK